MLELILAVLLILLHYFITVTVDVLHKIRGTYCIVASPSDSFEFPTIEAKFKDHNSNGMIDA